MNTAFVVEIITLIPETWPHLIASSTGVVGRAFAKGLLELRVRDLRAYGLGPHKHVDDAPYGGGAGMVLMADPLVRAIEDARKITPGPVLMLAPRGDLFVQGTAQRLSEGLGLVLVCGRYEGIDERVYAHVDGCLCIGEYVLSAGDPAAWCVVDAIARLRSGVLGNSASLEGESFGEHGRYVPPQYTRPMEFRGEKVPDVLRSGDHGAIAAWRARGGC